MPVAPPCNVTGLMQRRAQHACGSDVGRVGVGVGPSPGGRGAGHDSSVSIEIVSRAGLLINVLVNMTPIVNCRFNYQG